jgi:hypothetical protein
LNIRQIIPGRDGQWSVIHIFDEFQQLHNQLQKRSTLPSFPSSHHLLSHLSRHEQEKRRQELENYLKQLYVNVSPYEHPEFDAFLSMELHVNQIVHQGETEWKVHQQSAPPPPFGGQPPPYGFSMQ